CECSERKNVCDTMLVLVPVEQAVDLAEQAIDLYRLAIVIVAPGLHRLVAVAAHGMSREPDHPDSAHRAVRLESPGCPPPVHHRQAHIHEDDVGLFAARKVYPLLSVRREHHLEPASGKAA